MGPAILPASPLLRNHYCSIIGRWLNRNEFKAEFESIGSEAILLVEAMFLLSFGKYRCVIGFSGCDHVKNNAGQFMGRRGDGFGRSVTEDAEQTLSALLEELREGFSDTQRRDGPAGRDYLVGAQPFARLQGGRAEFRLRPEIAAAAARTGDTSTSPLGHEWVAFSPKHLDQYALDRAQSWFELAHRLAAEASSSRQKPH